MSLRWVVEKPLGINNVIGIIAPRASNEHENILVTINNFTKWVKVFSYTILKTKHVAQFIANNIICRFGVLQEVISDNGSHFKGEVQRIMSLYNIEHHNSSSYQS